MKYDIKKTKIIPENSLLNLYLLRHFPSIQNIQGYGSENTDLASREDKEVKDIITLIKEVIGFENIDKIILGKLERHKQSFEQIFPEGTGDIPYSQENRLTACFAGPLVENIPEQTEIEHNLKRFEAGADGLYHDVSCKSFDPAATGVFPFDALYSGIYVDRVLRSIVFPDDTTLTSFEDIEKQVLSLHRSLIEKAVEKGKPLNILGIGSCSINGFNLEKAAYCTTGKNMLHTYGTEGRIVFPQQHNELMVLGCTEQDMNDEIAHLRAYEGNVKIANVIERAK